MSCEHMEKDTDAARRIVEMNAMDPLIKTENISKWYHPRQKRRGPRC